MLAKYDIHMRPRVSICIKKTNRILIFWLKLREQANTLQKKNHSDITFFVVLSCHFIYVIMYSLFVILCTIVLYK